MADMSERSLRYLQKSDFGGTRSGTGKRKPNQCYVCDKVSKWLDLPRDMYFNKLPAQLILEIFKYLLAYELLRNVSLVCKYWYNLCRDRCLWTSVTWNGTQRTLGYLLQLTKYQVHELVLTDNLCRFSDFDLALLLKRCTHLKCLKLPKNACRELFKRVLSRTSILGGKPCMGSYGKDIEIVRTSYEHKRFLTPEEFLAKYMKDDIFSNHNDVHFRTELKSLRSLIHKDYYGRSVRVYDQNRKTPDRSCTQKLYVQDCRTNRRQHQPRKIQPRPPKGRNNLHKEVRKFRRLQKRFKIFSSK